MSDGFLPELMSFKQSKMRCPRVRYARLPLNNLQNGTVELTPTGQTLVEFKIPARTVFYLKKSHVQYQGTLAASAGNFGYKLKVAPFNSSQFGQGSGLNIVDIGDLDRYCDAVRNVSTNLNDFLSSDPQFVLHPSNQLAQNNIFPCSRDDVITGVANASTVNFVEKQYLSASAGVNTALTFYERFCLGDVPDCLFSMDIPLCFGQDMYLRFMTSPTNRFLGYTNRIDSPNNNYTANAANINLTNVYLHLAVERNLDIQNELLQSLADGQIKMQIPYVNVSRFSSAQGSTECSGSLTLSKNFGRAIRKISLVPYSASTANACSYLNHNNQNGCKINSILLTLDGIPLKDRALQVWNPLIAAPANGVEWGDDLQESQKYIKNTVLLNQAVYQTNWIHQEIWGQLPSDMPSMVPKSSVYEGLDLAQSGDHQFSYQATQSQTAGTYAFANGGLTVMLFICYLRQLTIRPDGYDLSNF